MFSKVVLQMRSAGTCESVASLFAARGQKISMKSGRCIFERHIAKREGEDICERVRTEQEKAHMIKDNVARKEGREPPGALRMPNPGASASQARNKGYKVRRHRSARRHHQLPQQ